MVEPSISLWVATNVIVPKKDAKKRVTTDFRALKTLTVTVANPMESVHGVQDWLYDKRSFSLFDLKDGYHQAELSKESRWQVAVRTTLGQLQYTRLPEGLKSYLDTFQRVANPILRSRNCRDVMSFVDDTNVGTEVKRAIFVRMEEY